MALFKRGNLWWTHFFLNGQRFRISLGTTDWREAKTKEKEAISQAQQGKLTRRTQQLSKMTFEQAVEYYLNKRRLDLAERSLIREREALAGATHSFGSIALRKLSPDTVLSYLAERKEHGLKNSTLNIEAGAIRRVLKATKQWQGFDGEIKRLPEHSHIGRAITQEQQNELLTVATSRPEWDTLYCAILLALNTAMRSHEIKYLRWTDIDLANRVVTIRRSKTAAGHRAIPLNEQAAGALSLMLSRARKVNGGLSSVANDYVFPSCESGKFDFSKPMKTWLTSWRYLTTAIVCPACKLRQKPADACRHCQTDVKELTNPLAGLRFHDLRHTAITTLAESQNSEQTVMSIAGHVSRRMLEHYSHIRMDAKRKAVQALGGGHDTIHATAAVEALPDPTQTTENIVEFKPSATTERRITSS